MEQSPGLVCQREYGTLCRLKRFLYDLKQSLRVWFGRFASVIQKFDLRKTQKDYSVFYEVHQGERILSAVYANDIVIIGDDEKSIVALESYFSSFRPRVLDHGDIS